MAGPDAPADRLVFVAILADWSPASRRVEPCAQAVQYELLTVKGQDATPMALIDLVRLDASESHTLQARLDFRTVPMFLAYYAGKLVYASNELRTAAEIKAAALRGLERGRNGDALSPDFRFHGADNSLLDSIKPGMSFLFSAAA